MEDVAEPTQENIMSNADTTKTTETIVNNSTTTTQDNNVKQEVNIVEEPIKSVQEPTYPIQDFMDNSKALGYKKEVVAGALFNCEKIELTKTEFQEKIKNFLGKKVE